MVEFTSFNFLVVQLSEIHFVIEFNDPSLNNSSIGTSNFFIEKRKSKYKNEYVWMLYTSKSGASVDVTDFFHCDTKLYPVINDFIESHSQVLV